MDRFQAMQVFVRVVDSNSFTRAAEALGLPRTTVTTLIQNLEKMLGVRLLNRTTRRLSLTPDGAGYYEHCVRILAEVEETEACFRHAALHPKGRLRIDVPSMIGHLVLIPSLSDFSNRYPEVEIILSLNDRPVDLVQDAIDCAIRAGELEDSTLVARRIGTLSTLTCAAPSYLARNGVPQTLDDLRQHQAVRSFPSRGGARGDTWEFVVDGQVREAEVNGMISANDATAQMGLALQGLGLVQTSRCMALPHLQAGELIEVLPQWRPRDIPISVLYPQNRQLSPKVRVFSDWVAGIFSECPLLGGHDGEHVAGECEVRSAVPSRRPRRVARPEPVEYTE